jgi:hypothetical protein
VSTSPCSRCRAAVSLHQHPRGVHRPILAPPRAAGYPSHRAIARLDLSFRAQVFPEANRELAVRCGALHKLVDAGEMQRGPFGFKAVVQKEFEAYTKRRPSLVTKL